MRAAGDAEVVAVVVVVAGEVVVAGDGDVFAAAAGEVLAVAAGEVLAAAAGEVFGEVCGKANPAGRAARRAIARIERMGFMETEPFLLMRFKKKLVRNAGPCQVERHRRDARRLVMWKRRLWGRALGRQSLLPREPQNESGNQEWRKRGSD